MEKVTFSRGSAQCKEHSNRACSKRYKFLFDLDSTITKKEILPEIAGRVQMSGQMKELTERAMRGEIPFLQSFSERVDLLKEIPVQTVRDIISGIPLNEQLVEFIKEHREDCYVVTGNLDIWICDLMESIGLKDHYCCSKGRTDERGEYLLGIESIIDKGMAVRSFPHPLVAVGDGNNDAEMIGLADVGIGFGGVRPIATALLNNATHAVYTEEKLCQLLRQL